MGPRLPPSTTALSRLTHQHHHLQRPFTTRTRHSYQYQSAPAPHLPTPTPKPTTNQPPASKARSSNGVLVNKRVESGKSLSRIVYSQLERMTDLQRNQQASNRQTLATGTQEYPKDMEESDRAANLNRAMQRRWEQGDVYAPHDLSAAEARKWKVRRGPSRDVFDALGVNPLMEYKNFAMMSEFMTEAGRIKHSSETGLRAVNQRKIAKAIRRAVGLGLMPSVHHHPEILGYWANYRRNRHRSI
ncbi:MAG: hypothetical protein M1816_006471 [Peltula sp. TS41687]|nr:MAG: hypothetical protein M1816_006471 [Peltula sp. TS41687]